MKIAHTDYLLYWMKTRALRVAVAIKTGMSPIVFTYRLEKGKLWENYESYCMYLNALTEEDGRELMQFMDEKRTQKAHNLILKRLSVADCIGPCGPTELSEAVPDIWFDGCKGILDLMDQPQIVGLLPVDKEYHDIWEELNELLEFYEYSNFEDD